MRPVRTSKFAIFSASFKIGLPQFACEFAPSHRREESLIPGISVLIENADGHTFQDAV
jgi:hypothetical protein